MRILVLGATGYIGSRLIPTLIAAGHEVVASSSSKPDPDRFEWGHQVTWRRCDVTDSESVLGAVRGIDAVCYLVHTLAAPGFSQRDRVGAQNLRAALDASDVGRLVYLSGLVPTDEHRSEHLASRNEVEEILDRAACSTLTMRAGVVIGAGSTSFEIIRQLASLLLVQPVPRWMRRRVQPIAVTDVVRALSEALDEPAVGSSGVRTEGSIDLGGPDIVSYPGLMKAITRGSRLFRVRLPVPLVPSAVASLGTALLSPAPFWTVTALIASVRHELVCRPTHTWAPADGRPLLSLDEAIARALGNQAQRDQPAEDVLESALSSDPAWTRMRAPVLDELHAPITVRAGVNLGLRRAGGLGRGVLRRAGLS